MSFNAWTHSNLKFLKNFQSEIRVKLLRKKADTHKRLLEKHQIQKWYIECFL